MCAYLRAYYTEIERGTKTFEIPFNTQNETKKKREKKIDERSLRRSSHRNINNETRNTTNLNKNLLPMSCCCACWIVHEIQQHCIRTNALRIPFKKIHFPPKNIEFRNWLQDLPSKMPMKSTQKKNDKISRRRKKYRIYRERNEQ